MRKNEVFLSTIKFWNILQVLNPNDNNEKDVAEMVFGSLPFSGLDECIKLHRIKGSMMWSLVFKPRIEITGQER